MQTGFYSPVEEQGDLSAMFVTADRDAPLAIVTYEALESAFLTPERNKPLFVKPQAFVLKALNTKGVTTAEVKKAFATLSEARTGSRAKKRRIGDSETCRRQFARAIRAADAPAPVRIGSPPRPA